MKTGCGPKAEWSTATEVTHPHRDNVGMRELWRLQRPVIYFLGIDKGRYRPFWPTFIVEDHPAQLHVAVSLYEGATAGIDLADGPVSGDIPEKSYARRLTLQRLHQPAFRESVLRAYRQSCAVCQLKHVELLDAAHILPDSDPRSLPTVPNGLALCKIHHGAFDSQILGVRPDFIIEIRTDVLEEVDGPMLKHGLQEVHGLPLRLPSRKDEKPNAEYVEERYESFRSAS